MQDALIQLIDEMGEHGWSVTIKASPERGYHIGYMWDGEMVGGGEDDMVSGDTLESAAERALPMFRAIWERQEARQR